MAYRPVTTGMNGLAHMRDLTARDVVVVTCASCRHRYNAAPHQRLARYHELKPISAIESDFRCRRCGATKNLRWHIMRAHRPAYPASA